MKFRIIFGLLILAIGAGIAIYVNIDQKFSLGDNPFGFRYQTQDEPDEKYVRSQMSICYKNMSDDCYRTLSLLLEDQIEYHTLLRTLEKTQNYTEVFSRCHELTHFIGRKAYESERDIQKLYMNGSPACWGGFYHGVIEGYFNQHSFSGEEQFAEDIKTVCKEKSDYATPRFFSECVHGIGHAMMFVSSDDLPRSLRWCDALGSQEERTTCYGGVFMENSSSSTETGSKHLSKYVNPDDPLYPCNILDTAYLPICYQYQASYYAALVDFDWKKNGELCMKVPAEHQGGCFQVIGSNQVGSTMSVEEMKKSCDLMPNDKTRIFCEQGVATGLTGRYIHKPQISINFCTQYAGEHQKNCFRTIGHGVKSWDQDPSIVAGFCKTENKNQEQWCLEGTQDTATWPLIN